MLSISLAIDEENPDNDENTIQSTIVDGLGFYATEGRAPLGFYVDVVSFSSEMRQFYPNHVRTSVYVLTSYNLTTVSNVEQLVVI